MRCVPSRGLPAVMHDSLTEGTEAGQARVVGCFVLSGLVVLFSTLVQDLCLKRGWATLM